MVGTDVLQELETKSRRGPQSSLSIVLNGGGAKKKKQTKKN